MTVGRHLFGKRGLLRASLAWAARRSLIAAVLLASLVSAAATAQAEDGSAAWLRYARLSGAAASNCAALPHTLSLLGSEPGIQTAASELEQGLSGICDAELSTGEELPAGDALVLGTVRQIEAVLPGWRPAREPGEQGFVLAQTSANGHRYLVIAGADQRGALYGAFALLRLIGQGGSGPLRLNETETPAASIRWVDQWDNLDGSIERGYAGRSIFFENGGVRPDLSRARAYARLLASVGINGITLNNVNASVRMLSPEVLGGVARIADAMRPYGVRVALAVNFSTPQAFGGLPTFDPLDSRVQAWWRGTADRIYAKIPDFAGFTVKADSEGKPGPAQYGRSPAQAANTLARALHPHGGLVLYRGFVYHGLDWHDLKADRAKAAYDAFHPFDGQFDENVVLQIKNGPIDFQVREPVSPIFAGLETTNEAMEVQISQEYTGQQRHLVYLLPQWKTALDTDMRAGNRSTPVREIVTGRTFHRPLGGFVGVANVGLDANWLHHPLALANLYGFGRLAWDPELSSQAIISEWTRLTFGGDPLVDRTIEGMEMRSWGLYESYTGPLGVGTLVDSNGHFGPDPGSSERNPSGQWLRADHEGVGMDRTVATGTGFIGQYPPELARVYESLASCPDNLLLFLHHVPYTYRLHTGKSVIQHVYDSHYEGAEGAAQLVRAWEGLRGRIDSERFDQVSQLLQLQAGLAVVWRDAITKWFLAQSGISDAKGRVGHYPDRVEAENMKLTSYTPAAVTPVEAASDGKAAVCPAKSCSATLLVARPTGAYRISVGYYDYRQGASAYSLTLNGQPIAQWVADSDLPVTGPVAGRMDGSTATRYTVPKPVQLKPGDVLVLSGQPDQSEPAPVDYLELVPVQSRDAGKGSSGVFSQTR